MSSNSISNYVYSTVTLGGTYYGLTLTVTSTGKVAPNDLNPTAGVYVGVTSAVGNATLINQGSIYGSYGVSGPFRSGFPGGIGVSFSHAGDILNNAAGAYVVGGSGGSINASVLSGSAGTSGGIGVDLSGTGTDLVDNSTNAGRIFGGDGGIGTFGYNGGNGASGVILEDARLTNSGYITGGDGGHPGGTSNGYFTGLQGGAGGDGADLSAGGMLSNSGHIAGGTGALGFYAGAAGVGVDISSGASVTNTGSIAGAAGSTGSAPRGAGSYVYTPGARGLNYYPPTLAIDFGKVGTGGASPGAAGAVVAGGGTLNNSGSISGGAGGYSRTALGPSGGVGVYLNGGTLTTSGTISGGAGGAAEGLGLFNYPNVLGVPGLFTRVGPTGYSVQFGPQSSTMVVEAGAKFNGNIGGFAVGDTVDITNLQPFQVFAYFYGTHNVLTTPNDGKLTFILPAGDTFAFNSDGGNGTDLTLVACFCRGTLIRSAHGEVPIETLSIGDLILTPSGAMRAVRWIGRRRYSAATVFGNRDLAPVQIRSGALADNVPSRDLWVSPEHGIYVDGILIPARALLNGLSITQSLQPGEVCYFHLEFEAHELIFAEGALSESFVDDESREMFDNWSEYRELYPASAAVPARFCAPRMEEGEELEVVRRRLRRRAEKRRMQMEDAAIA